MALVTPKRQGWAKVEDWCSMLMAGSTARTALVQSVANSTSHCSRLRAKLTQCGSNQSMTLGNSPPTSSMKRLRQCGQ